MYIIHIDTMKTPPDNVIIFTFKHQIYFKELKSNIRVYYIYPVISLFVMVLMTNWNHNGVIIVQAYKNRVDIHRGSGLRPVPTSLRIWTLNCTKPKDTTSHIWSNFHKLQTYSLKVPPCNYVTIADPNQFLLNKQSCFLPVPIIITDKQLM